MPAAAFSAGSRLSLACAPRRSDLAHHGVASGQQPTRDQGRRIWLRAHTPGVRWANKSPATGMDLVDCVHSDETVTVSDAGSLRGRCGGHGSVGMGLASLVGLLQFCKHVRAFFVVSRHVGCDEGLRGVVLAIAVQGYMAGPDGVLFAQSARPRTTDAPLEKRNASPEHIRAAW